MTNNHCVQNKEEAKGVKAIFGFEVHRSSNSYLNKRSTITCGKLIATDRELDFSILECQGNPGRLLVGLFLKKSHPRRGMRFLLFIRIVTTLLRKTVHLRKRDPQEKF